MKKLIKEHYFINTVNIESDKGVKKLKVKVAVSEKNVKRWKRKAAVKLKSVKS